MLDSSRAANALSLSSADGPVLADLGGFDALAGLPELGASMLGDLRDETSRVRRVGSRRASATTQQQRARDISDDE